MGKTAGVCGALGGLFRRNGYGAEFLEDASLLVDLTGVAFPH